MKAERGMGMRSATIVALSIPFAAGVAAAAAMPRIAEHGYIAMAACLIGISCILPACCRKGDRRAWLYLLFAILGCTCWVSSSLCGHPEHKPPAFAAVWLARFTAMIDKAGFSDSATPALLKALLTGQRGDLGKETVQAFRASGASHILALSGLHLGIIYACISASLKVFGNSRTSVIIRSAITVATCGLYTLITGAGPSTVRAFLFILLGEISRLQPGRARSPMAILCTALMIQLCVSPGVIDSVGFQLSYLAMLGIFLIFPVIDGWYPQSSRFDPMKKIWTSIALTVSCQLLTAPVVWIRFHTFPKYFLLTNLIALPITEALMISAVCTLALTAMGCCPEMAKALVEFLARALVFCLDVISGM